MIKSVTVINYLGQELKMVLARPWETGFAIFDMTGIGGGKAEIRLTNSVTGDGGFFNSARLPERIITAKALFYEWIGQDIEDIRLDSYKYFPLKKPVTIMVETNKRLGVIEGYVDTNEPVVFSKECWTQLSFTCPFPYFYDGKNRNQTTVFYGVDPRFEFPFSNESLTEPLLEFGEILNLSEETIVYDGDEEIGVVIYIDARGPIGTIVIHNVNTRQTMTIDHDMFVRIMGSGIVSGDRIVLSTLRNAKTVMLLRGGYWYNILNVLGKGTDWFTLRKGDNVFAFEADSGIENLMLRITNDTLFEGV